MHANDIYELIGWKPDPTKGEKVLTIGDNIFLFHSGNQTGLKQLGKAYNFKPKRGQKYMVHEWPGGYKVFELHGRDYKRSLIEVGVENNDNAKKVATRETFVKRDSRFLMFPGFSLVSKKKEKKYTIFNAIGYIDFDKLSILKYSLFVKWIPRISIICGDRHCNGNELVWDIVGIFEHIIISPIVIYYDENTIIARDFLNNLINLKVVGDKVEIHSAPLQILEKHFDLEAKYDNYGWFDSLKGLFVNFDDGLLYSVMEDSFNFSKHELVEVVWV